MFTNFLSHLQQWLNKLKDLVLGHHHKHGETFYEQLLNLFGLHPPVLDHSHTATGPDNQTGQGQGQGGATAAGGPDQGYSPPSGSSSPEQTSSSPASLPSTGGPASSDNGPSAPALPNGGGAGPSGPPTIPQNQNQNQSPPPSPNPSSGTTVGLDLNNTSPNHLTTFTLIQAQDGLGAPVPFNVLVVPNMDVQAGLFPMHDLVMAIPSQQIVYVTYGNTSGLGSSLIVTPSTYNPNPTAAGSSYDFQANIGSLDTNFGAQLFLVPDQWAIGARHNPFTGNFIVEDNINQFSFEFTAAPSNPFSMLYPVTAFNFIGFRNNVMPLGDANQSGFQEAGFNIIQEETIAATGLSDSTGYIGDVNNQGFSDMLFRDKDPNSSVAYLVYGNLNFNIGLQTVTDILADPVDCPQAAFINLGTGADHKTITYIGDINNDGNNYVAVSTPGSNTATMMVANNLQGVTVDTSNFTASNNSGPVALQTINITSAHNITGVYAIGDTNGDGITDFAVTTTNGSTGSVFVVYGQDKTLGSTINLDQLSQSQGYEIANTPIDSVVSTSGDLNGDNLSDFIISSASQNQDYLIYGFNSNSGTLTDLNQGSTLTGSSTDTILQGGFGSTLIQNGNATTLLGAGNDTIEINNPGILTKVDGGLGNNTLVLDNGVSLDLTDGGLGVNPAFQNIQNIVLTGNNTLTLNIADILALNPQDNEEANITGQVLNITNQTSGDTSNTINIVLTGTNTTPVTSIDPSSVINPSHGPSEYFFLTPSNFGFSTFTFDGNFALFVDHGINVATQYHA